MQQHFGGEGFRRAHVGFVEDGAATAGASAQRFRKYVIAGSPRSGAPEVEHRGEIPGTLRRAAGVIRWDVAHVRLGVHGDTVKTMVCTIVFVVVRHYGGVNRRKSGGRHRTFSA
jgi:hypothetical protein